MKNNLFFSILLCLGTTAATAAMPFPPSQIVVAFYAAVDAGDFDQAATFLSDDVKAYLPFSPMAMDKMAYKQLGMGMKQGFPDMRHTILDVSESKGAVAFKAHFAGTNTGPLQGNPPTGNRVETPFLGFFKMDSNGKITEVNIQFDAASFNAQLMKGINPNAAAEATVRNMLAAADEGDGERFISYWAANGQNFFAGKMTSQQDMKNRIPAYKAAFPDIRRVLDEVVVSGNTVTVRGWVTGTNKGKFMGNEPTGNSIKVHWLGVYKLDASGKVESGWVEFDPETLKNQVKGAETGMK
jgi:steroid delta-isomerase-like uncharacterized protein